MKNYEARYIELKKAQYAVSCAYDEIELHGESEQRCKALIRANELLTEAAKNYRLYLERGL